MLGVVFLAIAGVQTAGLPNAGAVEGALNWEAGSMCRFLIDHCLDGQGNDIDPLPQFTVSDLACRPAAGRRATCSFTSVRSYGPGNVRPSEHCTGTLVARDDDRGQTNWTFVVPNPRRPYNALLSCN
ncbi:MAG TPA: hypothetical protein VJS40_01735 [Aestuariivirgaceae bacterium]|nr:hypothetical protein [Aestuariivirgaceae bacterium]